MSSSDGGRLRRRETNRGPKPQKGRQRYTGAWREPKVWIVSVVEAEGKRAARCAPVIDATLQGPDVVCARLRTSWQRLGSPQADQGLFLADGAPWLWKRVPRLGQALGVTAEGVHDLLDFSHAVQRLGQVAALRKDWRAMRTHCHSFSKKQSRMAYAKLRAMKRPSGSGAIESPVRRVVNLRLKGPSLFWCHASAEAILLLRSYDKAERWNLLKQMATSHRALLEA